MRFENVNWIHLAQERELAGTCLHEYEEFRDQNRDYQFLKKALCS
jgi:hypothetical protein